MRGCNLHGPVFDVVQILIWESCWATCLLHDKPSSRSLCNGETGTAAWGLGLQMG